MIEEKRLSNLISKLKNFGSINKFGLSTVYFAEFLGALGYSLNDIRFKDSSSGIDCYISLNNISIPVKLFGLSLEDEYSFENNFDSYILSDGANCISENGNLLIVTNILRTVVILFKDSKNYEVLININFIEDVNSSKIEELNSISKLNILSLYNYIINREDIESFIDTKILSSCVLLKDYFCKNLGVDYTDLNLIKDTLNELLLDCKIKRTETFNQEVAVRIPENMDRETFFTLTADKEWYDKLREKRLKPKTFSFGKDREIIDFKNIKELMVYFLMYIYENHIDLYNKIVDSNKDNVSFCIVNKDDDRYDLYSRESQYLYSQMRNGDLIHYIGNLHCTTLLILQYMSELDNPSFSSITYNYGENVSIVASLDTYYGKRWLKR